MGKINKINCFCSIDPQKDTLNYKGLLNNSKEKIYDLFLGFKLFFNKDISTYTDKEKKHLVNLMSDFNNASLRDVKEIEKFLIERFTYDLESPFPFFLLTLFMYYFDNNFVSQINELLKKIGYSSIEDLLTDHNLLTYIENIKNKDVDLFYLLKNRLFSLKTSSYYLKQYEVLSTNNPDDFIKISRDKIQKALEELSTYGKNLSFNKYMLSYLNTIISYSNYDIPYLLYSKDDIVEDYFNTLSNIFTSLSLDNVSNLNDYFKVVILNNLKFFIDLSYSLKKEVNDNILFLYSELKHLISIDAINGLSDFTKDYSGLIVKNGISKKYFVEGENNKSYSSLLMPIDQQDLVSKLVVISKFSFHKTIKKFSSNFLSYLKQTNKDLYLDNYDQILDLNIKYTDECLDGFISKIDEIENFTDLNYLVKSFLIHFLDLPLNHVNLNVFIGFNFSSKLKLNTWYINKNITGEYNFKNISSHIKKLSIVLPSGLVTKDYLNEKFDLNIRKIKVFFERIFYRLENINNFLSKVEEKMAFLEGDKVVNHKETIEHLNRVGNVLKKILANPSFKENKLLLEKISGKLLLSENDFCILIGKLHDIGKAYNIYHMQQYSDINARLYSFQNLYHLFVDFLDLNKDFLKTNLSVGKFDQSKYEKILRNESVCYLVESFYLKYKHIDNLLILFTNLYNFSFFELVLQVYENLLGEKNFEIVSPDIASLIKYKLIDKLNSIEKGTGYFTNLIKEADINNLLLSFMVVFDNLSFLYGKQLKEPHVRYGLQFFSMNSNFSFLNWVLFHHKDYPSYKEIEEYGVIDGLNKWRKMIKLGDHTYFNKGDTFLKPKNKDFFMVLLASVDVLDALLSKRKYNELSIDNNTTEFIDNFFTSSFKEFLIKKLSGENFSDKNETFDKVIGWLDNDFKENPYWPEIKSVLIEMKEDVISFYN